MSRLNPASLSGRMAILGLLIEHPDQTVAEVSEGLRTRFTEARFDGATASHTLKRMARERRPGVTCRHVGRYRASEAGVAEFADWMYGPVGAPVLREALHGRIELARLEDLPTLVRVAREEAAVADDLYAASKKRLTDRIVERRKQLGGQGSTDEQYLREIRDVLLSVAPDYWSARSVHCAEIARHLESIAARAGIQIGP